MKLKQKILTAFSIILMSIFFITCSSNDKLVDEGTSVWSVMVASGDVNPKLTLMEMPSGKILDNDVYSSSNGSNLIETPSSMVEFENYIFLLMKKNMKIEVLDNKTYKKVYEFDFSIDKLEPSSICFPKHGTSAYVAHGNDSIVTLIDLMAMKLSKKIKVGAHPVSISISYSQIHGNQIYVANISDNTVSVIDTRSEEVEMVIPVKSAPALVEMNLDGDKVMIVSIGNGKLDTLNTKSEAYITTIDLATKGILFEKDMGIGAIKAVDQFPLGAATTSKIYTFIISKDYLFRFNNKTANQIIKMETVKYSSLLYNFRRDELIFLKPGTPDNLVIAEPGSGVKKYSIPFQDKIISILPR